MNATNNKPLSYLLQAFNYTIFMAIVWYFATAPSIRVINDDESMITLAFGHAGELREPCRKMSSEEMAKLPANMRIDEACPRERSPIHIEMLMDGELLYDKTLLAPGIYNDGGVNIFFSGKIPAGEHNIEIKMEDNVRNEGLDHTFTKTVSIDPTKIILFSYDQINGFVVK